ncbi:MAG: nitroreductase family protein [Chthonomonas sp.]|nr:nitroreductase family protein [Chthonomonas sp.]
MNNTTVTSAARKRVSIRKYTDNPLSREQIDSILDTAGRAPSPWNLQPWRVIVVTEPELKQQLMAAAYGQPQVGAAAAVFVVASDMTDTLKSVEETVHPGMQDRATEVADGIRATMNKMDAQALANWGFAESNIFLCYLLLAIEEAGLGSSPMLGFDPAKVKELLGLADDVTLPALVAVGEPAEEGFSQFRHPLSRWVTYR